MVPCFMQRVAQAPDGTGELARRVTGGDPTEEMLLVPSDAFARLDVAALANRLMSRLPLWSSERL